MRVLITGASGFAGRWLARACLDAGDEVVGVSRSGRDGRVVDLRDGDAVARLMSDVRPDVVYHLAALSHVGRSWEAPGETVDANVGGAVSVLEAVRRCAPDARVVWVSSSEVYGAASVLPISEDAPLAPMNPYAVSKVAGDLLAGVYADAHGLAVVRARSFSHAGPGQLPIFIISSLARQAALARAGGVGSLSIVTGNPDTRRDFCDVRDVVRAYRLLASADVAPGVYNVCSGVSVSATESVQVVASLIDPIAVEHTVDPSLVRAHEIIELRGSCERLTAATGWRASIPLRDTIADTIAWWEAQT